MTELAPDYRILVAAAGRVNTDRVPLYDHIIAESVMEEILGLKFQVLLDGNDQDINEYFRLYCEFYRRMGYDTVSYEGVFTKILPGGGALINSSIAAIKDRQDFDKYPFSELETLYYQAYDRCFRALRHNLPRGMKAVGGIGNGVFECVQDLTGYQRLCYMIADDPELYEAMFSRVGAVLLHSWERLLAVYGDVFCVGRFGDDLGFRTATLLSHDDICKLIVPCYRRIIDAVHAAGKPFLLHSWSI